MTNELYNKKIIFGEYPSGSPLSFYATDIKARKQVGTLKQLFGNRLIQRQIPQRRTMDWVIRINGVFEGTNEQINDFKDALFSKYGDVHSLTDGNASHSGSYVLENNGIEIMEEAEKDGYIIFNLDLVQYNQV